MCGNNGVRVNKQSYFSQTFYAYPPRREKGKERKGRVGAQEMCQLYGSLGRERETVEATCEEEGGGREDVETKDTLGEFQKGKRAEGDRY